VPHRRRNVDELHDTLAADRPCRWQSHVRRTDGGCRR
jgi:hypothetical protein